MIELKNVEKLYGKKGNAFAALRDINLKIPSGATVAIIGKSGSGKSTLMHIMSGLDSASVGDVIVDGQNLAEMKSKSVDNFRAKKMSFIFQAFFVEGNQTSYQNVMLPLEIAMSKPKTRHQKVLAALESTELTDKINSKAKNLSGGQRQRLAIARAIVNQPKLIFADEPTGNLDSTTGDKVVDLLFSLNKTLGSTLVVVTHDHDLARRCQMEVHLKDGEITSIKQNLSKISTGKVKTDVL